MTNYLGSVNLQGLVISESFDPQIEAVSQVANNGGLIVYEGKRLFCNLDLIGGDDWGWLSHSALMSLKGMASILGAEYVLDYNGAVYTVRFRTEDIPVIAGTPLLPRPNVQTTDFYNNVFLKLMEV